jgi:iron complex outermembrane receptor protein
LKQRISLLALSLVLGSSSLALGQASPSPSEPSEPSTEPIEPSETEAPATPEAPSPAEAAAEAGVEAEGGTEAGVEAAAAVEPEPAPTVSSAGEGEQIVVTGSRIKRTTSFGKAASVDVIDRKALEYSGATNLSDVIQYLTVSQAGGAQGEGAVPSGTSSVNLRGLGVGATLVLLNGRRLGPSGGGVDQHFEDLAVIPLAAVDRIEILKGGGSAIYGADAVGGVINIITRKNWDGFRAEGDALTTTKLDHGEYSSSVAWGATSERARIMTAFSYSYRQLLTGADRDFTKRFPYSQQGSPGTYLIGASRMPDPACMNTPGSKVMKTVVNGVETADATCAFDFHQWQTLISALDRANAYASAEFDLTNHTTAFGEFVVSRTRGDGIQSPSYAVPPPLPVIPANHVDNPFGTTVSALFRPLGAAAGPARFATDDDTLRILVGLKGDLEGAAPDTMFETWEWELSASTSVSRYLSQVGDTLRSPLNNALMSCSDPANLSGCFNPFQSAVDGSGTPNSMSVINRIESNTINLTDHGLSSYNAGMSGSLFELPGGDVGIAFGGEIRHEWRSSQEDHESNQQSFGFLLGNSDAKASRDVYSGFLELRWPFYDGIELQTAARLERYSDTSSTTPSPFVGLTITPGEIAGRENVPKVFRRLQLRGAATQAFRAPTIYQTFPGFAVVPTLYTVPGSPVPSYVPLKVFGNPALNPEKALVLTAGLLWQLIDEIGLSVEFWDYDYQDRIRPENSQQFVANFGATGSDPHVIVDPISGQIQRVEVKQINHKGGIQTNGFDFGGMFTFTGETFGGTKDSFGTLALGAVGTYTLTYDFPSDEAGKIVIPGMVPSMPLPAPNCSGKTCDAVGSRNTKNFNPALPLPRWRVNFPVTYSNRGHAASFIGHYISGLVDDNDISPTGKLGHVDSVVTFDAQYGYTIKDWIGKELTMRVGVYNLLDTQPPVANSTVGYDVLLFDPRGRMVYAKLITQF